MCFVSIIYAINSKGHILAYRTILHFHLYWKLLKTSFNTSKVISLSVQDFEKPLKSPSGNFHQCTSSSFFI